MKSPAMPGFLFESISMLTPLVTRIEAGGAEGGD